LSIAEKTLFVIYKGDIGTFLSNHTQLSQE